jgi:hypothetical protein
LAKIQAQIAEAPECRTFEDYCRGRWGWDRTYAYWRIQAAETAAMLPMGDRPTNERQARELARLKDRDVIGEP